MNTHAQKLHMHFEDPIAQVKVRRIMETLKHPVCTVSWVARLCRGGFPREKATRFSQGRNPNGTIQLLERRKKITH